VRAGGPGVCLLPNSKTARDATSRAGPDPLALINAGCRPSSGDEPGAL